MKTIEKVNIQFYADQPVNFSIDQALINKLEQTLDKRKYYGTTAFYKKDFERKETIKSMNINPGHRESWDYIYGIRDRRSDGTDKSLLTVLGALSRNIKNEDGIIVDSICAGNQSIEILKKLFKQNQDSFWRNLVNSIIKNPLNITETVVKEKELGDGIIEYPNINSTCRLFSDSKIPNNVIFLGTRYDNYFKFYGVITVEGMGKLFITDKIDEFIKKIEKENIVESFSNLLKDFKNYDREKDLTINSLQMEIEDLKRKYAIPILKKEEVSKTEDIKNKHKVPNVFDGYSTLNELRVRAYKSREILDKISIPGFVGYNDIPELNSDYSKLDIKKDLDGEL